VKECNTKETKALFNVKEKKKEERRREVRCDKGKERKKKRLYTAGSSSACLVFVSHEQRVMRVNGSLRAQRLIERESLTSRESTTANGW
jgi:hypothetical protein